MLKAIQERVTSTKTVSEAFGCLDTGVGFLTLQDFHAGLSQHFDLTLKQAEIAALFREVDRDEDGIVKYEEFDYFYREDYQKRVKALE
jgi:Ca2+-binding EF-hand superfamily protein